MLYITTRNKIDSFTAYKALRDGFAPDGGQFLPILMPSLSKEKVQSLMEMSFCDAVAYLLNVFFQANLTGWDVEFVVGKKPLKFASVGRKITVVEFWNNADQGMEDFINRIYLRLCNNDFACGKAKGWALIAIRIAFLFGAFALLHQEQVQIMDVAVTGKDFDNMMAVWYARKMGLPIGLILCGTNDNRGLWDLINKGQIDTGAPLVHTNTPDMDNTMPLAIERLVYEIAGREEALSYLQKAKNRDVYRLPEHIRMHLAQGLVSSVVGENRVTDMINSVYRTHGYFINPYLAISFSTLQDYRAKTGENRMTLLISENAPAENAGIISAATGVAEGLIKNA